MKNREEFLGSVYAKRDAELARRKKYKKKMYSGLAAAAACMVLMAGVGSSGLMDLAGGASFESAAEGGDGAMEGIIDEYGTDDMEGADGADGAGSAAGGFNESNAASASGSIEPEMGMDCAVPEATEDSRMEAYYCLPMAIILDEAGTSAFRTCGIEQVEDIRQWMESLEETQAARLDFGDGEELKLGGWTWKVIIEEEPRAFEYWYITGEVELYEAEKE